MPVALFPSSRGSVRFAKDVISACNPEGSFALFDQIKDTRGKCMNRVHELSIILSFGFGCRHQGCLRRNSSTGS